MNAGADTHPTPGGINHSRSKDASGRGVAVIAYGLQLGGIMTLVTAPLGALLALLWLGRSADWVATHLRYQIVTVLWSLAVFALGGLAWWLLGGGGMPPGMAWGLGYLVFTIELIWLVGRCAFGLNRLFAHRPVGAAGLTAR
ncbi:hypothetical protein [Parahaliea mediterranea]|uniref:hypothetical protein n=1 Tax=Parahaliea mediterranea TaxID=651086 RepID=UPI000E2F6CE8|nr:hypothetical protein [Parahaliea mediterranea]